MTIEGNWIVGAMEADFPDVEYTTVKLPAGPAGEGTLQYTNCWGIASESGNIEGAVSLVEHLTAPEQQLAFADAFGVMPSIEEAAEDWKGDNPEMAAYIDSVEFAGNLPAQEGAADVIGELNAQLAKIKSADPQQLLDGVQQNMEAVVLLVSSKPIAGSAAQRTETGSRPAACSPSRVRVIASVHGTASSRPPWRAIGLRSRSAPTSSAAMISAKWGRRCTAPRPMAYTCSAAIRLVAR